MVKQTDAISAFEIFDWKNWVRTGIGFFASVLVVGLIAAAFIPGAFASFGEFGDFVGGLANPLLALMGYLALLYTIKVQTNELALSREELALTREELERSATALEEQVATSERQRLSQAFFDLFQMYKSVVGEINHGTGAHRITGKEVFERYFTYFSPSPNNRGDSWSLERVLNGHKTLNNMLGSYFRITFRLLSFLEDNGKEAEFFADMFRAQLTTSELHLLFFNCVSEVGKPMQYYAAKFELFDNMPLPPRAGFEVIAREIDSAAFGKNEGLLSLVKSEV